MEQAQRDYLFDKDRLGAFMDAVIAIIMTILVLELEQPEELTWPSVLALWPSFAAYAVSFFSIAVLWVKWHRIWSRLTGVSHQIIYRSMLVLFFLSFLPYVTSLMARGITNPVAATLYAADTMLVAGSNGLLYHAMAACAADERTARHALVRAHLLGTNVLILLASIVIAQVAWPPMALLGVTVISLTYLTPAAAVPHIIAEGLARRKQPR